MAKIYDLTKGSIFKKIMIIALPVLLTSISQMAYNLTDMFWIGQVDGLGISESEALSAIGTAGYITWFAFGLILIARIGMAVKVSHFAGEKNLEGIRRYASTGMLLEIAFGLATSAAILLLRHPLISMFNLRNAAIYEYAIEYLTITGGLFFVQFVVNGFAAINEGLGKTITNLLILPIGLAVNMILDPIMIITLKMGVAGAAYATIIAQTTTLLVYVMVYIRSKQRVFSFRLKVMDRKAAREIVRLGFPAGLQSMFFTTCSIVIGIMVAGFGKDVFAAQRLGSQIEQFTWMIAAGFQTALTVFVGQNYGAKNVTRIRNGTLLISSILIPYSAVITLLLIFRAEWLVRLFIDDDVTVAYGIEYLRIISFSQIFMMIEGIGAGLFNGTGKTSIPSASGIVGNVMRIPLALWMSASLAQVGIWWALNLSDGFKGTFLVVAGIVLLINLEKIITKQDKKNAEAALVAQAPAA